MADHSATAAQRRVPGGTFKSVRMARLFWTIAIGSTAASLAPSLTSPGPVCTQAWDLQQTLRDPKAHTTRHASSAGGESHVITPRPSGEISRLRLTRATAAILAMGTAGGVNRATVRRGGAIPAPKGGAGWATVSQTLRKTARTRPPTEFEEFSLTPVQESERDREFKRCVRAWFGASHP